MHYKYSYLLPLPHCLRYLNFFICQSMNSLKNFFLRIALIRAISRNYREHYSPKILIFLLTTLFTQCYNLPDCNRQEITKLKWNPLQLVVKDVQLAPVCVRRTKQVYYFRLRFLYVPVLKVYIGFDSYCLKNPQEYAAYSLALVSSDITTPTSNAIVTFNFKDSTIVKFVTSFILSKNLSLYFNQPTAAFLGWVFMFTDGESSQTILTKTHILVAKIILHMYTAEEMKGGDKDSVWKY